ncbi:MAG: CPBP family intramembrane glutamic endopeptidase [Sedimentisphaerales bacterium]
MSYSSGQPTTADSPPKVESAQFFGSELKRVDISLLTETVLVTTAAILALRVLATNSAFGSGWFVAPAVLVASALIPTAIKKRKFTRIGFGMEQLRCSLVLVGWVCIFVFPALFAGLWLLKFYGLELPLRPAQLWGQGWVAWLFHQFLYVAVAEEVFFRGYVQANILRLAGAANSSQSRLWKIMSIMLSAGCFAIAHAMVHGQVISVLTFLPGLLLGWLFVQTRLLLAPILFHGLANCWYLFVFSLLVGS